MRRSLSFLVVMLFGLSLRAAPVFLDEPMTSCDDQFTVTLTTFGYTAVPTTPCNGRVGLSIRNPSTNTVNIVCGYGERTTTGGGSGSAPTWAAGGGVVELAPGGYELLYVGEATKVYCYSLTSAAAVKGQDMQPDSRGAW